MRKIEIPRDKYSDFGFTNHLSRLICDMQGWRKGVSQLPRSEAGRVSIWMEKPCSTVPDILAVYKKREEIRAMYYLYCKEAKGREGIFEFVIKNDCSDLKPEFQKTYKKCQEPMKEFLEKLCKENNLTFEFEPKPTSAPSALITGPNVFAENKDNRGEEKAVQRSLAEHIAEDLLSVTQFLSQCRIL